MKSNYLGILQSLGFSALLAVVIGLAAVIAGWLLGWETPTQFSDALFIAGGVALALGVASSIGGLKIRGDYFILYPQSAGDMNLEERSNRLVSDSIKSQRALILLAVCGILLIGVSVIVGNL